MHKTYTLNEIKLGEIVVKCSPDEAKVIEKFISGKNTRNFSQFQKVIVWFSRESNQLEWDNATLDKSEGLTKRTLVNYDHISSERNSKFKRLDKVVVTSVPSLEHWCRASDIGQIFDLISEPSSYCGGVFWTLGRNGQRCGGLDSKHFRLANEKDLNHEPVIGYKLIKDYPNRGKGDLAYYDPAKCLTNFLWSADDVKIPSDFQPDVSIWFEPVYGPEVKTEKVMLGDREMIINSKGLIQGRIYKYSIASMEKVLQGLYQNGVSFDGIEYNIKATVCSFGCVDNVTEAQLKELVRVYYKLNQ